MVLRRTKHGNLQPYVEIDNRKLPNPIPAPPEISIEETRDQKGRFTSSEATAAANSIKGAKKQKGSKLARIMPLWRANDPKMKKYISAASAFRRYYSRELASMAGGKCGAACMSMVSTAALQLAYSRYYFELGSAEGKADLVSMASKLGNESRQNLLSAYELATREAKVREQTHGPHDSTSHLAHALNQNIPLLDKKSNPLPEVQMKAPEASLDDFMYGKNKHI